MNFFDYKSFAYHRTFKELLYNFLSLLFILLLDITCPGLECFSNNIQCIVHLKDFFSNVSGLLYINDGTNSRTNSFKGGEEGYDMTTGIHKVMEYSCPRVRARRMVEMEISWNFRNFWTSFGRIPFW